MSAKVPFDGWARHPTAFSTQALGAAIDAIDIPPGGLAIDPFAGSGRAATALAGLGDRFFGLEAHPLTADMAQVKLSRPGQPAELRQEAADMVARGRAATLAPPVHPVLERFVAPDPLDELGRLHAELDSTPSAWSGHLRWLILDALRRHAGSGWPYPRPRASTESRPPGELVLRGADAMASDLERAPRCPDARIVHADARDHRSWAAMTPGSAQGCISSPPYLNQVSYAELLRLELHLLGWADSWADLRLLGRDLVACCTQDVNAARDADGLSTLERWPGTRAAVSSLCARLRRAGAGRQRPKRYDQVLGAYFADMGRVLSNLRLALAPGARVAWVIGDSAPYSVWVDTPSLLGLLATEIGFEVLDDVHLRDRGSRWTGVEGRHSRRLSERLLIFRRPPWGEQLELFATAS